jgi:outer membrane protein OmpA-like peptidoglycan-associated protein
LNGLILEEFDVIILSVLYMRNILICLVLIGSTVLSFAQSGKMMTVYFRFNDYKLDKVSESKLDSLLQSSVFKSFRIEAHCDSVGDLYYNDKLSMQRAQAVRQFLSARNIGDSLISINAMGKRLPLHPNETEESRALNRCVELYVSPINKPSNTIPVGSTPDSVLKIDKVNIGANLRLENINFEGGKHKLIPSSIPALQQLLITLKQYSNLEIEIQGYICCEQAGHDGVDFDTQTRDLSVNRAKAIYDYLVEHGISASRLKYRGYGADNKLVEERTEEDRGTNRRVEIKIVKK